MIYATKSTILTSLIHRGLSKAVQLARICDTMVTHKDLALLGIGAIGIGAVAIGVLGLKAEADAKRYDIEHGASVTSPLPTPSLTPVFTPTPVVGPTGDMPLIQAVVDDLIDSKVCDKSAYAIYTDRGTDVYVCIHMAIQQAEYLNSKGYDAGVVIIYNKYDGNDHAQTWVIIDSKRYILESIDNRYWTEEDHSIKFSHDYKIQFISIQKGKEYAKQATEWYHT